MGTELDYSHQRRGHNSNIAHIYGIVAMLAGIAVICFIFAEQLRIIAGIALGFAVVAGVTHIGYRVLSLVIPAARERHEQQIAWADHEQRSRFAADGLASGKDLTWEAGGTLILKSPDSPRAHVLVTEAHEGQLQIEAPKIPAPYDLSEEVEDWQPSPDKIFLGRSANGPVYVPVNKLWHVALTGPTGGGKTNISRLILSQLLSDAIQATCYLCDIHYAPIKMLDDGSYMDWRPIAQRLAIAPVRQVEQIYDLIKWLALDELQKRIDREYNGQPIGRPLTIAVEELPAVLAEKPEIIPLMTKILRQGRQYRLCFIGATQDMLVKTLGTGSGPRECFRTGYYTGGDATTAKVILDLQKGQKIEEDGLGIKGLVYLKTALHQADRVRVPFASNESIYQLLGVPASLRNVPRNTGPIRNIPGVPGEIGNSEERLYRPIDHNATTVPLREEDADVTLETVSTEERERIIALAKEGVARREMCGRLGKGKYYYEVIKQVLDREGL